MLRRGVVVCLGFCGAVCVGGDVRGVVFLGFFVVVWLMCRVFGGGGVFFFVWLGFVFFVCLFFCWFWCFFVYVGGAFWFSFIC